MTREEAKSILRNAAWLGTDEERELIEKAVELLCGEPSGDAISRQAAIDAINRLSIHHFAYEVIKTGWIVRYDAVDELRQLPSVTPKQRAGHWIECEEEVKCFCSECKEISDYPTQFCPNCGAKMEEMKE